MKRSHFSKAVPFVALLIFAMASIAQAATTVSLPPTDDSYTSSDDGNGNHGSSNYMIVGEWDGASPYQTCRSYLKFDLSSIPAGQTITSAILHLNCRTLYAAGTTVGAYFLSDDSWGEYTITWNNATLLFGAGTPTDTTMLAVGDNTWDVTTDVGIEYGTDQVYGVVMKLPFEAVNADGAWLDSKEYSDISSHPSLVVAYDDVGEQDLEYGDAPETDAAGTTTSFPTKLANNGARHAPSDLILLGQLIDYEMDGQPTLPADGDDINPAVADDEDGVTFPASGLIAGGSVPVIVVVNGSPGYLNVWVDYNGDLDWDDIGENVFADFPVNPGTNNLTIAAPPVATNPGVYARFRLTTFPNNVQGYKGIAADGEVEDYIVAIENEDPPELDFGDAPDPLNATAGEYPTLLASNGARHVILAGGPYFDDGSNSDGPDPEADGQPTPNADGDDNDGNDDEDGVVIPILTVGQNATITFNVAGSGGSVEAFIDWNADGDWTDLGEALPPASYPTGPATMAVTVPTTAVVGPTFARFRISTQSAAMTSVGLAVDGEVEDHEVIIEPGEEPDEFLKFQQLPLNGLVIDQFTYWGHDELSTAYRQEDNSEWLNGCYMADDFADLVDTPVIKVKWWGSYIENEIMEPVTRFLIAFERDIPAQGHPDDADYVPSHPGEVILSQFVHLKSAMPLNPGEYSETWLNSGGAPCYEALYEYEAVLENPFPQEPDTVYWIKIVALIDDPMVSARLWPAWMNSGLSLCEFLNLPFAQQSMYGLEMPVTRWGWHNRDYTKMDPYASTSPAVVPGEHNPRSYIPSLPPITGLPDDQVWHFQDDAVSGIVEINESDPTMPFVFQPTWMEEYYKYVLPYCDGTQGVDGPEEIHNTYSKDLAFELWTKEKTCYDRLTAVEQAVWDAYLAQSTRPNIVAELESWCWQYQCRGDGGNDSYLPLYPTVNWVIYQTDLTILLYNWKQTPTTADPAADYAHDTYLPLYPTVNWAIYQTDLIIMLNNWKKQPAALTDCPGYVGP